MAQVISVSVYRLGHLNVMEAPVLRGIPMPAEFITVPAANQPDQGVPRKYVYSQIIYPRGGGLFETVYTAETVAQLIVKANA